MEFVIQKSQPASQLPNSQFDVIEKKKPTKKAHLESPALRYEMRINRFKAKKKETACLHLDLTINSRPS
jgi:hypothetical protein